MDTAIQMAHLHAPPRFNLCERATEPNKSHQWAIDPRRSTNSATNERAELETLDHPFSGMGDTKSAVITTTRPIATMPG